MSVTYGLDFLMATRPRAFITLKGTNPFPQPASPMTCLPTPTDLFLRILMRTALTVLPFINNLCLPLFPSEHNLSCFPNLCPRLQSLLCWNKCSLFFITVWTFLLFVNSFFFLIPFFSVICLEVYTPRVPITLCKGEGTSLRPVGLRSLRTGICCINQA